MATLMYDSAGSYVEWYTDDDDGSGYGANPRTATWGDTLTECRRLVNNAKPPKGAIWVPIKGWKPDMSPGSVAWCEDSQDNV